MMGGQQHLLVVAGGIVRRRDDQETVQSRVQAPPEIGRGHVVAVIPAGARRLRHERVTLHAAAHHHRRAFLHRAINLGRHVKAVPVHDIVDVAIVADVDADLAALPQPQHRSRHGAVVAEGVDDFPGGELEPQRRDAQRMVRRRGDLRIGRSQRRPQPHSGCPGTDQEAATMQPRGREAAAIRRKRCGHGGAPAFAGRNTARF
jgi:hypothetical protein